MDQLMSDGAYKEKYRAEMIVWGEEKRAQDPNFFCRSAIQMFNGFKLNIVKSTGLYLIPNFTIRQ